MWEGESTAGSFPFLTMVLAVRRVFRPRAIPGPTCTCTSRLCHTMALLRASRSDRVQTCSAQAGNAIVYECIQTIMAVESESGPYTMRTPPPPHSRPSHMGHSSMYTRIALAVTTKDRESLRHPPCYQ